MSLFHVSSEKFSGITLSGSLFIPNGFVSCFLSEKFHGFYSSMNLLHFSSTSLFHVSLEKFPWITLSVLYSSPLDLFYVSSMKIFTDFYYSVSLFHVYSVKSFMDFDLSLSRLNLSWLWYFKSPTILSFKRPFSLLKFCDAWMCGLMGIDLQMVLSFGFWSSIF